MDNAHSKGHWHEPWSCAIGIYLENSTISKENHMVWKCDRTGIYSILEYNQSVLFQCRLYYGKVGHTHVY